MDSALEEIASSAGGRFLSSAGTRQPVSSGVVNKRELIRQLARKADVSRAEAADAVDELAHRIVQAVRRVRQHSLQSGPSPSHPNGSNRPFLVARRKGDSDDQPG